MYLYLYNIYIAMLEVFYFWYQIISCLYIKIQFPCHKWIICLSNTFNIRFLHNSMQYCEKFTCNVFAFIDNLQFKERIAWKNIDYVQRLLLSRYSNDFLTFYGVPFVINCTFCTFVLEDTFLMYPLRYPK